MTADRRHADREVVLGRLSAAQGRALTAAELARDTRITYDRAEDALATLVLEGILAVQPGRCFCVAEVAS